MTKLQDLNDKLDQLQTALDDEQQQIADAIAALEKSVEDLKAIIAEGGTEEERQALSDKLDAIITDLQSTINENGNTTSSTTTEG